MADRTSSTMTIEAPRSVIMAVIADFPAYPQWALGVRSTEVLAIGPGGRADRVRFSLDAGVFKDSYVLGYTWNGDDGVRWELAERGTAVSEMSGAYMLEDAGGVTKVTYELAVGLGIPMLGMLKRQAEKRIIDTALKGLKARVAQAGESGGGK